MTSLPTIPAKHADFLSHVRSHPDTPIEELLNPYNAYDAIARKIFAQEPSHSMVKDNHANIVPIYNTTGTTNIQVRARDLASETPETKEQYILPLAGNIRRPDGSSAVVPTLSEFEENFAIFTENSLSELDWSNIVAAGSAVVTSALPVPEQYRGSKRGRREYYHDKFAPASDVDLFLYGLSEEEAIEKIKHIETSIRNSILYETTTIRTKNTVTIASQYPTRHVQIVLRIYKSIAEILTGFDVDCSCAAYDGKQVYASPRAIASYITQINRIDLSRRSPSYENRLSKYSHRGFEVFWPQLDRSKVDPTIFERSFARTEGLARLLVLEKLPKTTDREQYLEKRRHERGRPPLSLYLQRRQGRELKGNVKDDWEDEYYITPSFLYFVTYHSGQTIPYGRRFNAKNIEKLLYTKDLLLNAQWNLPKDRTVNLHRHPAFFGDAEHVIGDCCGCCPVPTTDEEFEVAAEEGNIYISGDLTFIKDDPGRQEIGSFNPITETDWTEMAYIGHTERLCQAIVSSDLEAVKGFLSDENSNPDRRDYTGRTPLQLACMSSNPEIVQCLVDKGARLIARMADGKTALHLAAFRGSVEIIRILLTKSNENEEEEAKKQELRTKCKKRKANTLESTGDEEDIEMRDADDASRTSASFIKIGEDGEEEATGPTFDTIEENELDPDIYDINTTAWDSLATPLHLAILSGHTEVVKELVSSFGADVLMPVKIVNEYNRSPEAAVLNLVLVLSLPLQKAREMSQALLQLGASPAQADLSHCTPLHYIAQSDYIELFDLYMEHDGPAMQRSINHLAMKNRGWNTAFYSALMSSIAAKNAPAANKLLDMGANSKIEFIDWMSTLKSQMSGFMLENTTKQLQDGVLQPIYYAAENGLPLIAIELLRRGADHDSSAKDSYNTNGQTVLDQVRGNLKNMRSHLDGLVEHSGGASCACHPPRRSPILFVKSDEEYIAGTPPDSYTRYITKVQLKRAHDENKARQPKIKEPEPEEPGQKEKTEVIKRLIQEYELLETELLARNAKTWQQLHPPSHPLIQQVNHQQQPKEERVNYFKTTFNFKMPVLTGVVREGYRQLFDAAWRGDTQTIKALTLAKWGPLQNELPLEIAVTANSGISCLSIAITQGHFSVAEAIIEILHAQYKRKEPRGQTRFELDSDADSNDGDDGDDLNITSHIVDDQFTHENIGEIRTMVESDVTPLAALCASCNASAFLEGPASELEFGEFQNAGWNSYNLKVNTLLEYAVFKNDTTLVESILRLQQQCSKNHPNGEVPFSISRRPFQLAMALGHIECLVKMIQSGAAGLPIPWLSEKHGAKPQEEHLYYPGLSIRGKKRKDWATAGQSPAPSAQGERPPLLLAAAQGNLTATEWFLGTAPARHYMEYINAHLDDKDIQRLGESKLGLEGTVLNWLQTRNNLVLHCAVMARPCEESERLVQYLVNHHPECLEARSASGHTPLSLTFARGDVNYARILINGGANQTVRDPQGRNLLHFIFVTDTGGVCIKAEEARPLIDLLDKNLIPSMLLQRAGDESMTPLASWLHHNAQWDKKRSKVFQLLLDLGASSNQKQLELLSGSGNSPVHDTVKKQCPGALRLILDSRPDLLYRENATGNTPIDRIVDLWINQNTRQAPKRAFDGNSGNYGNTWNNTINRPPREFLESYDSRTDVDIMYKICQDQAQSQPGKRKLVSLFEANEVAKRLATTKCGSRGTYYRRRRRHHWGNDAEYDNIDEVDTWGNRIW
ncbi:hypothetical protein N7478_004678 [Penicillium angulare]|uniref:uncharacterized protein n=1 Tax=Penicillium angulare TaxID=116970 RepID=UPI00253FDD71|nr:uncharacterized protein N7478_004678 [Penicillium angulare]KAJ5279306.1 hypothetical protein N7478_004678 [Penicillium angulare]